MIQHHVVCGWRWLGRASDIDDGLIRRVVHRDGLRTKREAVQSALEPLAGAGDSRHAGQLNRMLGRGRHPALRPLFDFEGPAAIVRARREAGYTPRSVTDCLIAALAMPRGVPVLHADCGFDRMAEVVPLRIASI